MQDAEVFEAVVSHRVRLDAVLSANVGVQHTLDSYGSHPLTATSAVLKQLEEQSQAQQEYNDLQGNAFKTPTAEDVRTRIRERRTAIGLLETENAKAAGKQDKELLAKLGSVNAELAEIRGTKPPDGPPKSAQAVIEWLKDQLVTATAKQAEMLRAIEAADAKDQNTGARDVLKMRLKLQDDIIQLRVNAATGVRKLAIGAEGTEMTKVEVTYESARARSELLKRDLQADLQLAKREVAAARRKSKSGTAAKRRAEVEEPPAPTPSPKRPRREAPAPTSTSASARNGTSARSASASTSRAARAHSVTVPQGELPAPPAGFADWHDFYMSDEGLIDLAQAEARIQASMDPRQDRKRFRASFGNVLVTKPPCGICIKYDLPCLYIDPVQNPFAADKPPRCIICQEWKFHCNPRPGDTKTSPAPHVHAESIAVYHNAAMAAGERPGLWMGVGVPELKLSGKKKSRVKESAKED